MEVYFQGAISQLHERARLLLSKVPRNLPREFHLLFRICRDRISELIRQLNELANNPQMQVPEVQPERLRCFRRIVSELDRLENIAIAALSRMDTSDDFWINCLIETIRNESAFPLLPPVVTTLSSDYFAIYPDYGLLRIPLVEGHFLLHLPDLYHEMGHLLIVEENDPCVKPFHDAFWATVTLVAEHFIRNLRNGQRRNVPNELQLYMDRWLVSWGQYWCQEFFCDLFGLYLVGPAFAWAHLHLVAKRGGSVYDVPLGRVSTHPADAARMQVLLYALGQIGFVAEADEVEKRWQSLVGITGESPDPDYQRCYPDFILRALAKNGLEGVRSINCSVASLGVMEGVRGILNKAWEVFWRDPTSYARWEKETISILRRQLSVAQQGV